MANVSDFAAAKQKFQAARQKAAQIKSAVQKAGEINEQMDQANQGKKPMGYLFFYLFLVLAIIADVAEIVTGGTLGWIVGLVVDALMLLALGLDNGARKQWKKLAAAIGLETIPFVAFLPLRTVMIVWAYISSQPGKGGKLKALTNIGLTVAGGPIGVVAAAGLSATGVTSSRQPKPSPGSSPDNLATRRGFQTAGPPQRVIGEPVNQAEASPDALASRRGFELANRQPNTPAPAQGTALPTGKPASSTAEPGSPQK